MFYLMNKITFKITPTTKKSMPHHDNFRQSQLLHLMVINTTIRLAKQLKLQLSSFENKKSEVQATSLASTSIVVLL